MNKDFDQSGKSALLLTCIFLVTGIIKALFHEPWRDECIVWQYALGSPTLHDLYLNTRYEGHPLLWHLIAWIASKFTHQIFALQLINVLIVSLGVYLIARYSPFEKVTKILLIFSYFIFYEYSNITRMYGLGFTCLTYFCTTAKDFNKNPLPPILALVLLSFTSVFGVIIASSIAISLTAGRFLSRNDADKKLSFVPLVTVIAATALSVSTISRPQDAGFATAWSFGFSKDHFYAVMSTVLKVIFPIPDNLGHFWNTSIFNGTPPEIQGLLGVLTFGLIALIVGLSRDIPSFLFFMIASAGHLAFLYSKYIGYLRHQGHIFLIFIAALWIASRDRPIGRTQTFLLDCILLIQVGVGVFASMIDLALPFSENKVAAKYIRENNLESELLVGYDYPQAASVVSYLNAPRFEAASGRYGTYVIWDNRILPMSEETIVTEALMESSITRKKAVLILNHPLINIGPFELKFQTESPIVSDEQFYIYLPKVNLPPE